VGFNLIDQDYKSSKQLIQTMVKAAGYGANFLLNTGPMPNGKIQPENVDTLMIMGKWMNKYGETIYGTRRGPIKPTTWEPQLRKTIKSGSTCSTAKTIICYRQTSKENKIGSFF
jgi:alpha-L-fucosidase